MGNKGTAFGRLLLVFCSLPIVFGRLQAESSDTGLRDETEEMRASRLKWWTDARFGLFVHWGLYALPARHEWVKNKEYMTDADYGRYFARFDPDLYNAKEWARRAKAAGMRYAVLTAKHHEGFCLWDTDCTDYKVTNTPAGRDVLREFVDAFRAEGIRVGFYYSLVDWHPSCEAAIS